VSGAQAAHDNVERVRELRAEFLLPAAALNFRISSGSSVQQNTAAPAASVQTPRVSISDAKANMAIMTT
jgi:hypothetical protein